MRQAFVGLLNDALSGRQDSLDAGPRDQPPKLRAGATKKCRLIARKLIHIEHLHTCADSGARKISKKSRARHKNEEGDFRMKNLLRRSVAFIGVISCSALSTAAFAQSCTTHGESPMLAEMVSSGNLPPVNDRLPAEPLLVEVTEQIGVYGGKMVDSTGGNRLAEFRHFGYEPLVRWSVLQFRYYSNGW
mgnify:CR=1 FL=1